MCKFVNIKLIFGLHLKLDQRVQLSCFFLSTDKKNRILLQKNETPVEEFYTVVSMPTPFLYFQWLSDSF